MDPSTSIEAAQPAEAAQTDASVEAEPAPSTVEASVAVPAAVTVAAPDPAALALQARADSSRQKVEHALAALERSAARVSASSGGTRFSTVQKTQGALASELRELRAQLPDDAVLARLDGLLEKVERLVAALASPDRPAGADEAEPAASPAASLTSPGAIRQALIRGMITLAPAPLHLQIEFAPDFPLGQADPITLAARSHAVNRAVLGSLRRIQWETPDRCSLWFGDGEQRRIVAAGFDAQGKVDVPQEYRQKQNPPGERKPASGGGRPAESQPRRGNPGQQAERRERKPPPQGQAAGPNPPAEQRAGRNPRRQPGSGPQDKHPQGHHPQSRAPGDGGTGPRQGGNRARPPSRPGAGRPRDDRQGRPAVRGAGFPANSTMADKLRAALAPAKPEAVPAPAPVAPSADAATASPAADDRKNRG